ncbi:MAG: hypothetical protein M3R04_07330 [bacterium]|nr:hypothetical protein [bacterium]
MGTGKLLKVLLSAVLALLLAAPTWAEDIKYIESEEGNPELPSTAPMSGELELPLLPEPEDTETSVEDTVLPTEVEAAPVEDATPLVDETSAPVEQPLLPLEVISDSGSVVEIDVPITSTADSEITVPTLPDEMPGCVEARATVTTEVVAAESPGPDAGSILTAAGDLLYSGDVAGAVTAFEEIVNTPGIDQQTYSLAASGYAAALRAAGRRGDAEHWFQESLILNPDDNDLRMAYAYTLAENDKLDRALYQLDIIDKSASGNDAVTLARARAFAWSGQYDEALRNYNLVDDPKLADDAMLGSAYVLYWQGRESEARTMLGNVDMLANNDVSELYAVLGTGEHEGRGTFEYEEEENASLAVTHRNRDDSEGNVYTGTTAALKIPLGPKGSAIFISHEDFDLDNDGPPALTSSGTNTRVGFNAQLDEGSRLSGYAGRVSIDNTGAQTIDHTDIGAALAGSFSCDWTYNIAFTNDLLYDSPALARAGISMQNVAVSTKFGVLDDDTTLELMYDTGELSDGNSRVGYAFDLRHAECYDCRGELAWGLRGRDLSYQGTTGNAYFSPDSYQLAEIYLDWLDKSNNDLKFDANVCIGMQSIDDGDWQNTLRWALGLRADLSRNFILRAGVGSSDLPTNAAQSGDYNQQSWYVNGEWVF